MSIENFKKDLEDLGVEFIVNADNDFIVEETKTVFEYCEFRKYCETISHKHRSHHVVKQNGFKAEGYMMYVIFEDEYINKRDIVISRLRNLLKRYEGTKVDARKCTVREIDTGVASEFVTKFHIQGNAGSRVKLGMFTADNELVSVMTFGKLSRAKGNKNVKEGSFELVRFCSDSRFRCVGAAGKLMAHFLKNYDWQFILTFADKRWSPLGQLYKILGFKQQAVTDPNYYYLKVPAYDHRTHRFAFRRDVLRERAAKETTLTQEEILSKTEFQLATALGYDRIWDCGNFKFTIEREDDVTHVDTVADTEFETVTDIM